MLIHLQCINTANVATLVETGKIEGKFATRVPKSVLIFAAKWKYKLRVLFFKDFVSYIFTIYVSLFRT